VSGGGSASSPGCAIPEPAGPPDARVSPDASVIGPEHLNRYMITADALNDMRSSRVAREPLHFSMVFAPAPEHADPEIVTAATYAAIIDELAYTHNLVVIDTQTVEAYDTSGLIDTIMRQELSTRSGWAVGIADPSTPAVTNLRHRIKALSEAGANASHLMVVFNRQLNSGEAGYDIGRASSLFESVGATMIGSVPADEQITSMTNSGAVASTVESLVPLYCSILLRATGLNQFSPEHITRAAGGSVGRTKAGKPAKSPWWKFGR